MRNALLIARREYIAYVTAWGFWLGLLLTPLGLSLGFIMPSLVEQSTPSRYYAVLDDTNAFRTALADRFRANQEQMAKSILSTAYAVNGADAQDEAVKKFEALREQGVGLSEALSQSAPPGVPLALPTSDYYEVELPGRTPEEFGPYLSGERLVDGPFGERELYAVLIYKPGDIVEYWSDDVVSRDLVGSARLASRDVVRNDVLRSAGVSPDLLRQIEREAPSVVELSPSAGTGAGGEVTIADRAPFFAALALSFMLWLLIFSVVNFLLTGTIEERSNKIFDALLTGVNLPQLLTGKLLGVLMLSLTLIVVWGGFATTAGFVFGRELPDEIGEILAAITNPALLVPALLSFLLGYLMYGAIFLALGSLCDTIQEAQSLMSPIIILMMLPLLMLPVTIGNPSSSIVIAMSWVPVFTPFLLILRIPSEPAAFELVSQLVMMVVFTGAVLWLAARVYRAGAVHGTGISEARAWFGRLIPSKSGKA